MIDYEEEVNDNSIVKIMDDTQWRIAEAAKNDNVLIRWPTGRGKTLPMLYLAQTGRKVLVIVPLKIIATQVVREAIKWGISAFELHGDIKGTSREAAYIAVRNNTAMLIATTPETVVRNPGMLVYADIINIDEAHCASIWSDMRPDFWRMLQLCERVKGNLVLTSATMTKAMLQDIVSMGWNKTGLTYSVLPVWRKNIEVFSMLGTYNGFYPKDGRGIIFCQTIEETERISTIIPQSLPYHSKLAARTKVNTITQYREGKIRRLVATPAAGMGLDEDCDFTIHSMPALGLESQLQEIGRAGRRHKESQAYVYWTSHAWTFYDNQIKITCVEPRTLIAIYNTISDFWKGQALIDLNRELPSESLYVAIHLLERRAIITVNETSDGEVYIMRLREMQKEDIDFFTEYSRTKAKGMLLSKLTQMRMLACSSQEAMELLVENYFQI